MNLALKNFGMKLFILPCLLIPLAMSGVGCDSDDGPAESVGQEIDDAVEETKEAVEEAKEEIKDEVDDATTEGSSTTE